MTIEAVLLVNAPDEAMPPEDARKIKALAYVAYMNDIALSFAWSHEEAILCAPYPQPTDEDEEE